MKKLVYAGLAFMLALVACNKKGDPPFFWESINGIYIKDTSGIIIDSMGTPDVHTEDSTLSFLVHNNPSNDTLRYTIVNHTNKEWSYKMEVRAAEFKNMPKSIPSYIGQGLIPVENVQISGAVKSSGGGFSEEIGNINSGIIVTDLPKGFYKLLITTGDGKKYWDNIWIYRP